MADETRQSDETRQKVVTLRSLELPSSDMLESASAGPQSETEKLTLARYQQVMERLRQETQNAGAELMITVPDREVSLLQSEIARRAEADRVLDAGGLEAKFGTGFGGGDWFGWIRSVFDHVDRRVAHPQVRPATTSAEVISDTARVALTADWGTGLYGAPKIADQMRQKAPFDVLMHLGDVYYSGTEDEVQHRFLDPWPRTAGRLSRTLNSNHEMYSGGFGYFKLALPALGQASSYFAFQNRHWLLVCLDTAYVDHDMDNEQVAWLNLVIDQANRADAGHPQEGRAVFAPAAVLASRQSGPQAAAGAAPSARRQSDHRMVLGSRASMRDLRSSRAVRPVGPLPRQRWDSRGAQIGSQEGAHRATDWDDDVEAAIGNRRQSRMPGAGRSQP